MLPVPMSKLKLKKAGKVMHRARKGAVRVAEAVVEVAEAIVAVAALVEKMRQASRRVPSPPAPSRQEAPRSRDSGADA